MTRKVPTEFVTAPGADPHPANAALRARCPVHEIDYPSGADAYVVVDYETNEEAFADSRLSKEIENAPDWYREMVLQNSPVLAHSIVMTDPPDHSRLRKIVSRAFMSRRLERLRPRIQQVADDLIDAFPDSGEIDLMSAFAIQLPLMVICEFLGVPVEDRTLFLAWARVLSQSPNARGEASERLQAGSQEVSEYFAKLLADRRADLREDFISELNQAVGAGTFTEDEALTMMIFLIIAGQKTTAYLIGNGTAALLRHQDQLELLRKDPELVSTAIEEFLRYEGSVDRGSLRVAAEDLRLGGVDIPRQSFVHLSVSCANRDPAVFDDPDMLDITRTPNRHMAFGHGAHFCAGAPLARLEGGIAFTTLLRRLPEFELVVPYEELPWVADSSIGRGLTALPIRFSERLAR